MGYAPLALPLLPAFEPRGLQPYLSSGILRQRGEPKLFAALPRAVRTHHAPTTRARQLLLAFPGAGKLGPRRTRRVTPLSRGRGRRRRGVRRTAALGRC